MSSNFLADFNRIRRNFRMRDLRDSVVEASIAVAILVGVAIIVRGLL